MSCSICSRKKVLYSLCYWQDSHNFSWQCTKSVWKWSRSGPKTVKSGAFSWRIVLENCNFKYFSNVNTVRCIFIIYLYLHNSHNCISNSLFQITKNRTRWLAVFPISVFMETLIWHKMHQIWLKMHQIWLKMHQIWLKIIQIWKCSTLSLYLMFLPYIQIVI